MNTIIILTYFLLIDNIISEDIINKDINHTKLNKVNKVNKINQDFSQMMDIQRKKKMIERNQTSSDFIIKHTYNNTKLRKKKVTTKVQEYLSQIKENNNKVDNIIYNTYLKTKNKNIKNMYFRYKDRYKEKEL